VERPRRRWEDDVILNRQNERIWPKLMLLRMRSGGGGTAVNTVMNITLHKGWEIS
jgi:hypothetical protein